MNLTGGYANIEIQTHIKQMHETARDTVRQRGKNSKRSIQYGIMNVKR